MDEVQQVTCKGVAFFYLLFVCIILFANNSLYARHGNN